MAKKKSDKKTASIIDEPKHKTTQEILDKLEKEVNSAFDKPVVIRASKIQLEKIATNILSIDYETGGGIPRGRWITLVGDESTFKSSLLYSIGGTFQRICGNCLRGKITETNFVKVKVPIEADNVNIGKLNKPDADGNDVLYSKKYFADGYKRNVYCPDEIVTHKRPLTLYSYELKCSVCNKPEYSIFLLIDNEHNYTKVWARKFGVIHHSLALVHVSDSQQSGDVIRAYMDTGRVTFVGVDSVDAQGPREEHGKSVADQDMGLQARVWNKITRILTGKMNVSFSYPFTTNNGKNIVEVRQPEPTICKIHQWREKIGMFAGADNRTIGGGRGGKYADSLRIDLSMGERDYIDEEAKKKLLKGVYFNFYLGKQKTGMPYRKGRFYFDFANEKIVEAYSVIEYGIEKGLIKQSGAWYEVESERVQGKLRLVDLLEKNPALMNKLKNKILQKVDNDS